MPRSGTTLVEQIIASHPDVHGAGELYNVMQLSMRLPGLKSARDFPMCLSTLDSESARGIANRYQATEFSFLEDFENHG